MHAELSQCRREPLARNVHRCSASERDRFQPGLHFPAKPGGKLSFRDRDIAKAYSPKFEIWGLVQCCTRPFVVLPTWWMSVFVKSRHVKRTSRCLLSANSGRR